MPKAGGTTQAVKHPGRKRRLAGWLLLAIGVLITGVWGASRWWWFGYCGEAWGITTGQGSLGVAILERPETSEGWFAERRLSFVYPWFGWADEPDNLFQMRVRSINLGIASYQERTNWKSRADVDRFLIVALQPFALASLLGGGWLVWSARRARRRWTSGVCLKCGYDLSGLAAGAPCPECGDTKPDSTEVK